MSKIPYENILDIMEKHFDHLYSDVKNLVDTVDEQQAELKKASARVDELEEQVKYYKGLYEREQDLHLQLQNRMDLV